MENMTHCIPTLRISKLQKDRIKSVKDLSSKTNIPSTDKGQNLYSRIMILSSHYNAIASRLLSEITDYEGEDDNLSHSMAVACLSLPLTRVHACKSVRLADSRERHSISFAAAD